MRGSTGSNHCQAATHAVSPAHAGIDLRGHLPRLGLPGLPRACGDRPAARISRFMARASPPRMRGSTFRFHCRPPYSYVSPAHAGIDLVPWLIEWIRARLPRACGDRPPAMRVISSPRLSPPRMRGSTPADVIGIIGEGVSPAHAGIDPCSMDRYRWRWCLPRACGDRPRSSKRLSLRRPSPPRMRGSTLRVTPSA